MKQYKDSISEVEGENFRGGKIRPLKEDHRKKQVEVSFQFEFDVASLQARVDNGEIFTLQQIKREFGPNETDVLKLTSWLRQNGWKDIERSNDGFGVFAKNTTDNISKSLNCEFSSVECDGLCENVVAVSAPNLPLELKGISSIDGLQPFGKREKKSKRSDVLRKTGFYRSANTHGLPYKIKSVLKAYGGDTVTFTGLNQTIGILIDSFPYDSDLVKFWNLCGVNTSLSRIKKINVRGVRIPAPSGEESLDTQWTSGIAPQAIVSIYAIADLYFTSLNKGLDRMISDCSKDPTFRQISISLGIGEKMVSTGEMNTENSKYLVLRSLGVNIFVSSGDGGSNPYSRLQVEFPACNPNVVAVGGTTLNLNSSTGSLISETAWSGSGGGISGYYTKPSYQSLVAGSFRLVPDVSALADPNTGAMVILSNITYQIGGTSLSAPIWAGICALINDARVRAKKSRIPFISPRVYSSIGSSRFRDITTGSNGQYSASTGYDRVTGVGVPNISNLISYFLSLP